MKTVPLHGKKAAGRVVLVSDEDYGWVMPFRWNVQESHGNCYAIANGLQNGRPVTIAMHRLITGWTRTDHINGDGLDNRRENLREVTAAQNNMNRRKRSASSSRYKGVTWIAKRERWVVNIRANRKQYHLGSFASEVEAARAYDAAARKLHGEYAALNFPDLPPLEESAPRICPVCQSVIEASRHPNARYCSRSCRKVVNRQAQREHRQAERERRHLELPPEPATAHLLHGGSMLLGSSCPPAPTRNGMGAFPHLRGGVDVADLDVYALVSATEAAEYAEVSVSAVCNWKARGYLPIATDERGREIRDGRGRPRYRLLDVAKAEHAASENQRGVRKRQVA